MLGGQFLGSAAFSPLKVFCAHLKTFVDLFAFLAFELFVRPTRDYRVERVVRLAVLNLVRQLTKWETFVETSKHETG